VQHLTGALVTASAWPAGVLDPQGAVAAANPSILLNATAVMLAIVVLVIVLTLVFAWWYRAGNARARRRRNETLHLALGPALPGAAVGPCGGRRADQRAARPRR